MSSSLSEQGDVITVTVFDVKEPLTISRIASSSKFSKTIKSEFKTRLLVEFND